MERLALTPTEVAEVLGISRAQVYNYIRGGSLPSFKIGSRTYVSVKKLEAWIEQQHELTPAMPIIVPRAYNRRHS